MSPWVQLGATLFIGILTAGGAFLGVRMNSRVGDRATNQREIQARREEWSTRFYQALGYALDGESSQKREIGSHLLAAMADSDLADRDELMLMQVIADRVLKTKPAVQQKLTDQEQRLLTLLQSGMTQEAAAESLGIAHRTVRRKVHEIIEKRGSLTHKDLDD